MGHARSWAGAVSAAERRGVLILGFSAVMSAALVLLRDSDLVALPFAAVGIGTSVALLVGRRVNRPAVTRPWTVAAGMCLAFLAGAVLRQVLVGSRLAPLADAATLCGYGMMLTTYAAFLRNRTGGRRGPHEHVDALIVLVATGAAVFVLLTLPTAAARGISRFALLQGAYPVIDVAVVFAIALLAFTSATRTPSFWLLAPASVGVLVGDLGYAVIGTQGGTVGSPLLDLPFLLAFGCLGASALHPSMVSLSSIRLERELHRHGVPPACLVVEITESAMMADEETSAEVLHRLRDLGVALAVDDFGTGYSSLGHLRRFPVSKVKIDRGFVAGVDVDRGDAAIVRAVVAMSHAMGLEVVAEGIETESQRRLLAQAGIALGQGWLFGRPDPAEDCAFATETGQALRAKS